MTEVNSAGTIVHRREVIQYGEKEKSEEESSEEEGQEESGEEENQEKSSEEESEEESQEKSYQEKGHQEKSHEEKSQEKKEKIGRKNRYGGFFGSKRRENNVILPGILLNLEFSKSRDEIRQATLACINGRSSRHGGIFHFFVSAEDFLRHRVPKIVVLPLKVPIR